MGMIGRTLAVVLAILALGAWPERVARILIVVVLSGAALVAAVESHRKACAVIDGARALVARDGQP